MRRVTQRGLTDCGIACVAMLAGVSYRDGRAAVCGDGPLDYEVHDLQSALKSLGWFPSGHLQRVQDHDIGKLGKSALVRVQLGQEGPGHWVVWDAELRQLIDPMEPPKQIAGHDDFGHLILNFTHVAAAAGDKNREFHALSPQAAAAPVISTPV